MPTPPSRPFDPVTVVPVPVVPPVVDPVDPVDPVVPVVPVVAPVEEFTVDEPVEPCVVGPPAAAEAIWLAAVLPLLRVACTAALVCALRWSTVVVFVGAMVVGGEVVPVPVVVPEELVTGVVMTGAVVVAVKPVPEADDDVPNEWVATAAGMACAITGAAKSAAIRRASEAALVGLRIRFSLMGMKSEGTSMQVACPGG
jgi:hypothetical protein